MNLRAALVGFGTVGSGAVKTLFHNHQQITSRAGCAIELVAIADTDLKRDRGVDVSGIKQTTDAWELIKDPEIDVIIELVGGYTIAKEFVIGALQNGKDVVTANKALLALHADELFKIANENNRHIYFEGAVGGGIPLIQSFYGGLASAKIEEIHAIINGTCNYILTEMDENGSPFQDVLKAAQDLGYAELDPSFDIGGVDAAHKIALMASICFGTAVPFDKVYIEGIEDITVDDIEFGRELGYKLKLLAIAKDLGEDIEVRVHPTFIPKDHLLASVNGVYNAVNTFAPGMGETILYGRGAGDMPTGHAVVSDLIQCALDREAKRHCDYSNYFMPRKNIKPMSEVLSEYYLRFEVKDQPGVLAGISGILGEHNISILFMLQTEKAGNGQACPIAIMTHEAQEGNLMHALEQIKELDYILAPVKVIRIEQLDPDRS